jgi:choline dehydrogenase-like flavoprotein
LEAGHAELNLLATGDDRNALRAGVRLLAELLREPIDGFVSSGPDGTAAADVLSGADDDLDRWMAVNEGGTFHITGTAPMSHLNDDAVDEHGRVRDLPHVWIIDASALATPPFAAPLAAILTLATTGAERLLHVVRSHD